MASNRVLPSNSKLFLESVEVVRNARHTSEIQAVLRMFKLLEEGAVEELVSTPKDEHDAHVAVIQLLRKLHAHIVEPTFAERQATFQGKP